MASQRAWILPRVWSSGQEPGIGGGCLNLSATSTHHSGPTIVALDLNPATLVVWSVRWPVLAIFLVPRVH